MIVTSSRFLRGHSPLYDGSDGMPKAMFFTATSGLLFVRKSLYENEFCGSYGVLYTLRGDQQYRCGISL